MEKRVGIYSYDFITFLESSLFGRVEIKSKNIICRCPWCELNKDKDHYHLWISTELPIFHCFHCSDGNKNAKGHISKLLKRINGTDISDKYIDHSLIKKITIKDTVDSITTTSTKKIEIPPVKINGFESKADYLNYRFSNGVGSISSIHNLILDVYKFIEINNLEFEPKIMNMLEYLHTNFIGFVTSNMSCVVFRNIDKDSEFRYYKLKLFETPFLDYYSIRGNNICSDNIILGEGVFDIYSEYLFNNIGLDNNVLLYASAQSNKYSELFKSIMFNDSLFYANIHILSDRGIELDYYKKIHRFMKPNIKSLNIYYNVLGKDFNDVPCKVEKITIQ